MKKLILIHGALGNSSEFDAVIPHLEKAFEVVCYEIPHHGKKKDATVPFNVAAIVDDFLSFLEAEGKSLVYGFSLGGYVALAAAQQDPKNIEGIIAQGTKFDWSPAQATIEMERLNIATLKEKVPRFYEYLCQTHGSYLETLIKKTSAFMEALGHDLVIDRERLRHLGVPVRITRGGKDQMVTKSESIAIAEVMPNGHYFEIPSMIHPIGFIQPKNIARLIEVQSRSIHYHWVDTPHGRMAYQSIGNVDQRSPVLLFLHEAIGSIAQWKDFPEKVSKVLDLPAIVAEFPGYGFSSEDPRQRDHRYLHDFALKVLPAFIQEKLENRQLLIIGHSDGGTNALLYASTYPENVEGIVTMAAHYINEKETREGIQPAIDAFKAGKLQGLEYYHGAKTEHLFHNWARTWLQEDFKDWDISETIRGMNTPALIIQGEDDQYGTDRQVHGIAELINSAQVALIENCGHAPHLEQASSVITSILQWKENFN
ncbi:MAG: alpha/beta fold hydrolase [Bacteroidota bacterium]